MMKPNNVSLAIVLVLALVGPLAVARAGRTPPPKPVTIAGAISVPERHAAVLDGLRQAPAATATAPAVIVTTVSPNFAPTQPVTLSVTPTIAAGETATNAPLAAALIWVVIIIVVAVTVFLVWRTRPKRG
jgi:hypothetical protein